MPRAVIFVDTVYDDFLKSIDAPVAPPYAAELRKFMDLGFGTFDAYSFYLKALGWQAIDLIVNHTKLQELWANGQGIKGTAQDIALEQIEHYQPDVVFLQDLSFFDTMQLAALRKKHLLAGQCSCPMPKRDKVAQMDVLFTSFPHYVKQFEHMGVQAEYLPLAFDPRMVEEHERDIEVSFVGGVGKQSHWNAGTETLEAVARHFGERFHWYGYGLENLEPQSALRACYRGQAWGRQQYRIYARSKVVVNRHGEVAQGMSNNLRLFEATGMGAFLFSELTPNLGSLNPYIHGYKDDRALCEGIDRILTNYENYAMYAKWGQRHTMSHHTYADRMPIVSKTLNAAWARRFSPAL